MEFVGHPLVDLIPDVEPRGPFLTRLGLAGAAPTVALLPGSRRNELRATAATLADAARLVSQRVANVQFVVARAPHLDDELFAPLTSAGLRLSVVEGRTDDVLNAADTVVTASGTATVQTALHERPMVIVYRLSPLTYRLGRRFVRVNTFGMANLVAGKTVVPELIQDDFTPRESPQKPCGFSPTTCSPQIPMPSSRSCASVWEGRVRAAVLRTPFSKSPGSQSPRGEVVTRR